VIRTSMTQSHGISWGVLTFVLFSGLAAASAQELGDEVTVASTYEPRLKFLDDLWCVGRTASRRDPFEERIETERHDFTQSTTTVGRGVAQIEAGYTYFYSDLGEEIEHSHTTPEALVRLGLTDDIELRVHWTYAWSFVDEGENVDSAEDLRWSLKLRATDQDGCIPESAVELRSTAPTGGPAFSTQRVEFGVDYIYGWKIAEGWGVYGSTGFGTQALGDFGLVPEEPASDHFTAWTQSVSVSTELTRRTSLYNEVYGVFSAGLEDDYAETYFNTGLDYYVTNDLVLDLRAGVGLTPDSDDFFGGVGGGYRF
jgi:hypothetical protein